MKRINMLQFNGNFMRPIESSHTPLVAATTITTGPSSDNPPQSSTTSTSTISSSTHHHHQHQIFSPTTTPSSPPPPPPPPQSITATPCFDYLPIHSLPLTHPDNINTNAPTTVTTITHDELDIPEFKQYDKEKYESAKSGNNRRRRKSTREECDTSSSLDGYEEEYANANGNNGNSSLSHAEVRRRMHIQSEQKRRAEIKDGFEDLRRQLPISNHSRKMSKAMLLQKTVSHIKNMKSKECYLIEEINRLNQYINYLASELDREKRMNVIHQQKETLDKLYQIGL